MSLFLCCNQGGSRDGFVPHRKTVESVVLMDSGDFLERQVALGSTREATFGLTPGNTTGLWRRIRRRYQFRPINAKTPRRTLHGVRPPTGSVATPPGKPPIRHAPARQSQLRVGVEHQPTPAIGLLRTPRSTWTWTSGCNPAQATAGPQLGYRLVLN